MKARGVAITLAVALVLAACGGDDGGGGGGGDEESGGNGDAIRVGVVVSATGPVGFFGTEQQRGFELAEEVINEDGGVDGTPIELDIRDNRSTTEESLTIFQSLINDESIVATIGPTSSRDSLVVLKDTAAAGVPSVTLSLASGILELGENIFRPIPSDRGTIGPFVPQIVEELGLEQVAILNVQDDPLATDVTAFYEEQMEAAGVEIVAHETYLSTDTEWSAQLLKVEAAGPDALIIVGFAQEGGNILLQTRELGIDVPVLGSSPLNSQAALDQAGESADELYLPDIWHVSYESPENEAFVAAYREKYDAEPTRFAATAYSSVFFLVEGLAAAEDPHSREAVIEALAGVTSFPTVGTPVEMEDRQAVTDEPLVLVARGGKFELVS